MANIVQKERRGEGSLFGNAPTPLSDGINENQANQILAGFSPSIDSLLPGQSPIPGTEGSDFASNFAPLPVAPPLGQVQVPSLSTGGKEKAKEDSSFTKSKASFLAPLSAGLQAGTAAQVQTPDAIEAGAGIGVSTLSGVASGALSGAAIGAAGGPVTAVSGAVIGGLTALAVSGSKAWFGVRSARKRNRELKELQRKQEQQRAADIARNEKWMKINRFDNLRVAADNRKQVELQNKWQQYQNVASSMTNLMNMDNNLNQVLKAQMGG